MVSGMERSGASAHGWRRTPRTADTYGDGRNDIVARIAGDIAGDACDDIVPAVAVCISRTWRAPPSVRGSAGPFHTAHHINRNVWKAMMAMTYATAKLSRTDRAATFVPNCRRISATVARHGV